MATMDTHCFSHPCHVGRGFLFQGKPPSASCQYFIEKGDSRSMFRKNALYLVLIVLITSLALTACGKTSTPAPAALTVTDGLGRTVTLEVPVQRIVSLAASNTEILYAVGAGAQVVGRDEFSDYPTEAKALPSVGGSFGKYTTEAIVNLKPDLVLAAEINTPELVQSLQDLGLKVYLLPNPTTIDGVYQNLTTVAQLTGHEKETKKLVESLQKRVKSVLDKVAKVTVKSLVFYELDSTDPNAPYTAGPGTFVDLLIQMAGGQNLGSSLQGQWAQISAEQLIVKNPDLIILGDSAYGVTAEAVGKRPGWEALQAVKNGSIYPFDDNLVSRPGPRLVDGLEAMAKLLHPEIYK